MSSEIYVFLASLAGTLSFATLGISSQSNEHICKNAQTQVEMNECTSNLSEIAAANMQKAFEKVSANLGPLQKQRLIKAQQFWIEYRTELCKIESEILGGCDDEGRLCGSIKPMTYFLCLRRENMSRLEGLEELSPKPL